MDFNFDKITKHAKEKGFPAAVGGAISKWINKNYDGFFKPDPAADPKNPGMMQQLKPFASSIIAVGLVMDGKDGFNDYMAAGMIGAGMGDYGQTKFPDMLGQPDNEILADELDKLFEQINK